MTNDVSRAHTVIENTWIPLADGTRLATRMWMPEGAEMNPVPAILEFLPYRKRDGTSVRDESTYPTFAAAGYAGVRVDMRGAGDSDGLMTDEYTPQELADAVEVIEWLARQPWCTGSVGMMGISWGGFNALQVAALQPEPLKAIITIASTVDRFNDDIHYKGGALLAANLSWSGYMLCYSSRPPDPALVGDGWRKTWLSRLEAEPLLLATWLKHQTRDDYWRHGSVCEDYAAIKAATLIIAGWGDGYKNAPPAAAAGLKAPVKAMNGPWVHKYPHFAWPKPRADFLGEAIGWWDHWLKGERNGAESLPAYRAYITEAVRPSHWRAADPGRWVAEERWPSPAIKEHRLVLNDAGVLSEKAGRATSVAVSSPLDCGVMAGEYFTLAPNGDLPADQRSDDAGSLVLELPMLEKPIEILGRPRVTLQVAIDAPVGTLAARLVDVHPDGTAQRVSFGILNLTHRGGHADPKPMTPGAAESVEIVLDECGHRFLAGHRVRLAISTAYWPLVLPSPTRITATIELGGASSLALPVRAGGDSIAVPEPTDPDPLPHYRQLTPGAARRWIERDLNSGITTYRVVVESGETEIAAAEGLIARELRDETYSIAADDPLSAVSECRWTMQRRRGDWSVRTETATRLTADATHFHITGSLAAYEGDKLVLERSWKESIERVLM